ncbi:MAG: SEC-C domain-containing protein [Magnetococcales bacterium]|nr:SEC-C domain-containing protein [Magnetococcales bacterium]
MQDREKLAAWLAEDENVTEHPFWKWYAYFADRLIDMAPKPEHGFQARPTRTVAAPKIGRNDVCPCQSGKKFKQCHMDKEESVAWKIGSPTPAIRAMAVSKIIQALPISDLDKIPQEKASDVVLTEVATAYHAGGRLDDALLIVKKVLDGDREDPHILWDYWIARYAEWLVEADKASDSEQFLMDEYDAPRKVAAWQVAQKLAAYYVDIGDSENAETWVDTALEGNSENPFNHYLKGLLLHSLENWEEAEAAYAKAKELSANFREEERAYMTPLVEEAIDLVKNRKSLDDESVETETESN